MTQPSAGWRSGQRVGLITQRSQDRNLPPLFTFPSHDRCAFAAGDQSQSHTRSAQTLMTPRQHLLSHQPAPCLYHLVMGGLALGILMLTPLPKKWSQQRSGAVVSVLGS